jgi:hypothetical protein
MNQITYRLQQETIDQSCKVPDNVISGRSHRLGLEHGEPLVIMMDALIRYAKAHEKRFESKLAEDYVLGPEWLKAASAIRQLLNGDGAVAHELGRNTDSKDNGAVEGMFWDAMAIAGFKESDL